MPFHQADSLRFWTFGSFAELPLEHAIFTRQGGVSPLPYESLNLSRAIGDTEENVRVNEERIFSVFGRNLDSAADSYLQHGTQHIYAIAGNSSREGHIQYADILLTDKHDVTLFMRYGDCLPILYFDQRKGAIALAHAGWRGTLLGVAVEALAAMEMRFQSKVEDIVVGIGPGICARHYEVGAELVSVVNDALPDDSSSVLSVIDGKSHFNLVAANRLLLEKAGVQGIEDSGLCTAEHLDDWFSHRAEHGQTGRFGALMALK